MICGFQEKRSKAAVLAGFLLAWFAAGLHTLEDCDGGKVFLVKSQGCSGFVAESKDQAGQSHHDSRSCSICSSGVVAFSVEDEPVILHLLDLGFVLGTPQLPVGNPFLTATLARGPPIL